MLRYAFFFCLIQLSLGVFGQSSVIITIIDANSNERLPFTTVSFENETTGFIADIDGMVKVPKRFNGRNLILNHLGYEEQSFLLGLSFDSITIKMTPLATELSEVTVIAGENPAHPIIKKLSENRKWLDPKKRSSYSLNSYNKIKIGTDHFPENQSEDSTYIALKNLLSNQYFFFMESETKRYFKSPDKEKEIVLKNRVSGFQQPQFAIITENLQDIGFFEDYISILDIPFLNPISKNSINKYYFDLSDSIVDAQGRKNYVIGFEPKNNSFNGLKGTLIIDADEIAIKHVQAETSQFENIHENLKNGTSAYLGKRKSQYDLYQYLSVNFRIQQSYERIGKKSWFPISQKADIYLGELSAIDLPAIPVMIYGETTLADISFDPFEAEVKFDRVRMELVDQADKDDSKLALETSRRSEKEQRTLTKVDSLFKENNMEKKIGLLQGLITKKITLNWIDLDFDRSIKLNEYEGLRVGLGLSTSKNFSKRFEFGGYAGYGIRDKAWKYGGFTSIHLLDRNRLSLTLQYSQDLRQFGEVKHHRYTQFPGSSELYYPLLVNNMVHVEKTSASLSFYVFRYLDGLFEVSNQQLIHPELASDGGSQPIEITELSLGLGFSPSSDFIPLMGEWVLNGRSDFYAGITLTKGLNISGFGDYNYEKLNFKIQKRWRTTNFGFPTITILGGASNGNIPVSQLFSIRGTANQNLDVVGSFRTMGINEFISTRYINAFYSHRLFQLNLHQRFSKPQFYIHSGWTYGWSQDEFNFNESTGLRILNDHYVESGLTIRQLFRINTLSIGAGVSYRYGSYQYANEIDNLAVRLDLGLNTGE